VREEADPTRESSLSDFYNHPEGGIRGMQELTQERTKERWMELCEQAAVELDSQKLMALISEINRMLDSKMQNEEHHEHRAGFSLGT
jgi:truncated hemoglobin YjbI